MARRRPRKPAILKPQKAPDAPSPEVQAQRERLMEKYDGLPAEVRQALSSCAFDIHIGIRGRHFNIETLVKRIGAIRTIDDAVQFNAEFVGRRGFMRF